jgi:multiple sugar transport system permease protein/fructooligosaccharide transport system permease protein
MKKAFQWLVSIFVAAVFLAPLLWMIQGALLPEDQIFQSGVPFWEKLSSMSLENFSDAWRRTQLGRAMLNSFLQVVGILGLGILFNSMAAFAFARFQFRGRDLLFSMVVAMIILPVEVLVIPLFLTARDFHLTGGPVQVMLALILPFSAKAMNIFFLRQHFLSLPTAQEEAAQLDGAGWFRIFFSIALPSIRPALATVVVLDLITHWSDFIWPLVVCTRNETRTVQIALANLFTQPPVQWGDILACAILLTLPILACFRLAQKYLVASEMDASEK